MQLTPIRYPAKAIAADLLGLSATWADDKKSQQILTAAGLLDTQPFEADWILTAMVASSVNTDTEG